MSFSEDLQERIWQTDRALIAARIKEAREMSDHVTLDRLGQALGGVTRQHLIKLEKGIHRPRPEMLTRIADATGKPVDFFLAAEVGEATSTFPVEAA